MNEECGAESSDEEEESSILPSGLDLALEPDSPQEPNPPCNVMATFAPKPPAINGQTPSEYIFYSPSVHNDYLIEKSITNSKCI